MRAHSSLERGMDDCRAKGRRSKSRGWFTAFRIYPNAVKRLRERKIFMTIGRDRGSRFFFFFTIQIVIKSPPARRMEVCRASWKKKNQQFGRLNSNRSSNDTNDYGSLFAALFEPPRSISILPFFLFPSSLPSPTSFIEPLYSSTTINLSSRISPSSSISCERDSTSLFKIYSGCY